MSVVLDIATALCLIAGTAFVIIFVRFARRGSFENANARENAENT